MSDPNAYPDEMTNPFGPTDDELDGLYAGVAPTEQLEEVAAFMLEVKTTCSAAPSEDVASGHVAAMAEEARRVQPTRPLTQQTVVPAERNRWRRVMDRTISTVLKGAAGVLAASMSMMGLAYAGVDLPGQAAANAIEAVTGVELPNQDGNDDGKSVAEDVKSVVENSDAEGCEFGQEVAAAASQNAQGDGPGSDEDPCAEGDEESDAQGSKATGDEKSAEGRAKATEKSGGASDAGADNATSGTDRGSDGPDNSTSGSDAAEEGKSSAPERPTTSGDEDDGDDGDGQATAGESSGGASGSGASNAEGRP